MDPTMLDSGLDAGLDAGVVSVATVGAGLCAAWLGVVAALALTARLRGPVGVIAAGLARHLTPRPLHGVLGLGVAAALVATPGTAVADGSDRWPDLDRPAGTGLHHPVATAPYVVRAGDCLWTIAERDLADHGRRAGPAAVATAWPRWYAANRSVIGPDPNLLRPGDRLRRPTGNGAHR